MTEDLTAAGRGRSIWTRPERSARGPVPEHSRAEIASAGIALADARGLGAVTMRSAAAAIGTGPASLYRYVATRDELVELMADQVYGEYVYPQPDPGHPVASLLQLAHQGRAIYHRHPWLLDIPATGGLPGPNAVAFIEHALAALAGVTLSGPAKLETIALFAGALRVFAQTEISQQRAGQDTAQWQDSLAGYLTQLVAAGQYPHLAAALAGEPAGGEAAGGQSVGGEPAQLFDRAMTRILTGLLLPEPGAASGG
jgi:AcrR family transcriptional regulator